MMVVALALGIAAAAGGDAVAQIPAGQGGQVTPPGGGQPSTGQDAAGQAAPGGDLHHSLAPGAEAPASKPAGGDSYDPSGRRDPFKPIGLDKSVGKENPDIPPLQRVGLTELSLIGIMWGGFGYTAMVQTPDGKGYTIRRGTKVGPNGGVVSSITENSVIVKEQYRDVYGKEQVHEYVKHLHTKEGSE